MPKTKNYGQKLKLWPKIKTYSKGRNYRQKNQKIWPKTKCWPKIVILDTK